MKSKLNETLSDIFDVLTIWKNQEKPDIKTMEKIQEMTNAFNEWEENEFRQALLEEREQAKDTVVSTITFGGNLPLREIQWEEKGG